MGIYKKISAILGIITIVFLIVLSLFSKDFKDGKFVTDALGILFLMLFIRGGYWVYSAIKTRKMSG
jgi:hypothetical protein